MLAKPGHRLAALVVAAHKAPQLGPADIATPPHKLGQADLVDFVRGLGGTPEAALVDPDIVRLMLPALRADLKLDHGYRYRPAPPLKLPIHVFGGRDDPLVTPAELAAWNEQTSRPQPVRLRPGGHFFLTDDPDDGLMRELGGLLHTVLRPATVH
jgi:surfactin synthase thioesterase subunit